MRALFAVACLAALPARATEGFYVELDGGMASWSFDEPRLATLLEQKVGPFFAQMRASEFAGQLQSGPAAALRLGFNILGHASIEAFFQGAGWDVASSDRGGGAVTGLLASWHPLELFLPGRDWDLSFGAGGGYGIVGEDRAMDGGAMVLSFQAEWAPVPFFAVAGGVRRMVPFYKHFIVDWEHQDLPGGSEQLPDSADGSALFPFLGVKFLFTPRG